MEAAALGAVLLPVGPAVPRAKGGGLLHRDRPDALPLSAASGPPNSNRAGLCAKTVPRRTRAPPRSSVPCPGCRRRAVLCACVWGVLSSQCGTRGQRRSPAAGAVLGVGPRRILATWVAARSCAPGVAARWAVTGCPPRDGGRWRSVSLWVRYVCNVNSSFCLVFPVVFC